MNYLCRSFLSFSSVLLYLINDKVKLFISLSRKTYMFVNSLSFPSGNRISSNIQILNK